MTRTNCRSDRNCIDPAENDEDGKENRERLGSFRVTMHRKSAYILFLAVLAMLVIGIVMLFSTSAFARDSHGDVYFFVKRQAVWLGIGLVVCIDGGARRLPFLAADLVDLVRRWRSWLSRFVSCRMSGCASTVRAAGSVYGPFTFQPSEIAKIAVVFFLACWFARYEKASGICFRVSLFRSHRRQLLLALIVMRSRSRNDRA